MVICSNGLGHLRRVFSVISEITRRGYSERIDIFASSEYVKILASRFQNIHDLVQLRQVNIVDFVLPARPACVSDFNGVTLEALVWNRSFPEALHEYELVWSDNLLGVLESRPDAKLTGSFFWYEVLSSRICDNPQLQEFINNEKSLVTRIKPPMAGSMYFSTPDVKLNTKFTSVGLYQYESTVASPNQNGVLVACGLGGEEEDLTRDALSNLLVSDMSPPGKIFVEPRLMPKRAPSWMVSADFSPKMFNQCVAACIRPGLGTVSDALVNNHKVFGYAKFESFEMRHNGAMLEELNLGEFSSSATDMLEAALDFAADHQAQEEHFQVTVQLDKKAVQQTADFIIE